MGAKSSNASNLLSHDENVFELALSSRRAVYEEVDKRFGTEPKKISMYDVFGFGMYSDNGAAKYLKDHFGENLIYTALFPKTGLTSAQIVRVCVRKKLPSSSRHFLQRLLDRVKLDLRDVTIDAVVLTGHSHGGLLATLAAEELSTSPEIEKAHLKNLYLLTTASIYTTALPSLGSAYQYMYPGDIALRCVPKTSRIPPRKTWYEPSIATDIVLTFDNACYPTDGVVMQPMNKNGVTFVLPQEGAETKVGHNGYSVLTLRKSLVSTLGLFSLQNNERMERD